MPDPWSAAVQADIWEMMRAFLPIAALSVALVLLARVMPLGFRFVRRGLLVRFGIGESVTRQGSSVARVRRGSTSDSSEG